MDTVNEIERKQRAERQQIRSDAELFDDLMKHKGWARYMSLVRAIAQNYHASIMKTLGTSWRRPRRVAKGVLAA
jgi:hypothetical protein